MMYYENNFALADPEKTCTHTYPRDFPFENHEYVILQTGIFLKTECTTNIYARLRRDGDQPWDFFGRNDAKAETPVLWPPHVKS